MIVGGAQENTLLCCRDLVRLYGDEVLLITGPALGPEGDLLAHEDDGSVRRVEIRQLRRAIHPFWDWQCLRALKRILAEFRPDVVHTHSAKGGFLGRLAARAVGVPVVVHTVHGAPFHPYQNPLSRWLFRQLERYAAAHCDLLVSVSDAMTELLVEAGVAPREKFVTVYSGMQVERFLEADVHRERMRARLGFEPHHVVIGKIARLFRLKGHEYLIAAAEQVARACPDARFLLVGDGVLRRKIERRVVRAGLSDRFRLAGLVPPSEIPAMIGAMDVLVHTSLREGLARALPQALIAGRPVVSFDIDGAREVVRPGTTGYLIPPCQVQPLADALVQLCRDPALRSRLGAEGRRLLSEPFHHETMTRRLRQLYEQLLERRGQPRPSAERRGEPAH